MDVWTNEGQANSGLNAIRKAKKALERGEITKEEYEKLRKEMIDIAMHSTKKAKIHFFEYLPD